ncbi:efflux RND transporter periplasmic adaptor subunit [Dysgonomonas sp. GY617]|uniref:efflux RND transporter periplasmic adaptor subunit n=1 Tax=Dysgonomonas sp. GY617 TaxID=2780420 RepID=UPI00188485BF|nr:efflux RND transporter periplasmic adaptor subunit [Dysgonomonas sp. GY617]MBF0576942.1 efflux RND transporter periplasmic adaptor subunit [Dysgonomonas sp. GY617]
MNKKAKIALIIAIVLIIAGMAFYPNIKNMLPLGNKDSQIVGGDKGGSREQRSLNVNAQVLKFENLNDVFRTKGILIPDEEVDLAFETSGKITEIYFKEGSFVKKGDLLAKVNDSPLQAELKKLEAQKPLAEDRVFRQKSLLAKDAVSQEAYESVNTELGKLHADIELVKAKIAQTELRAPFTGVIGLRLVSEGAYATSSTIISKLTKISPLKIEFSVNERQANDIKAGTPLIFTLDNDLNKYKASVYAIESNLDKQTLTLKARAIYQNEGGKLKPGHSANIEIQLQEIKNTLVIPSLSTVAEMGRDIAYIYKDGKAHQVELKKGMRTASSIQVLDGLKLGDTLLVSGVMQLRDGMPVTLDNID